MCIRDRTEGIPFFVEEFMKSLKDLGMIEWRDSGYYLAKDIQEVAIPSTIQEVIMARVDSLPDGAKGVLQTGSAIGREFSCELIKRVTGIPTPEMTPHLSVLRDSELLYERGIFPQATYIFRHSLTQEVAYDSLLQKRKQEIHERIGQAIEELYSDRIEELYEMLAYHYSKSENHEKAYQYLRLSSIKAGFRSSMWEAFHFVKQAIDVLNELPDTDENKRRRVEAPLLIAGPMAVLGFPEDSLQLLQDGERLARELGDEKSRLDLCGNISIYYSFHGDSLQAMKYAESAFEVAENIGDVELLATIGWELCVTYAMVGEVLKINEIAPRVIALLEETQKKYGYFGKYYNFNLYSAILAYLGHSIGALGNFEEGEALCEKALHFAIEQDNIYSMMLAAQQYGFLYLLKGEGGNAIEHLQNTEKYAEQGQSSIAKQLASTGLGMGYFYLGELETALKHLERSLEMRRAAVVSILPSYHYFGLSMVHLSLGDIKKAHSDITESVELAHNSN